MSMQVDGAVHKLFFYPSLESLSRTLRRSGLSPSCPPMPKSLPSWLVTPRPTSGATFAAIRLPAQAPDALDRAMAHICTVRSRRKASGTTIWTRHEGHLTRQCQGGVTISLDLEKAFDSISWPVMQACLVEVGVQHARYCFSIDGQEAEVSPGQGIRQGCGMAPAIWTIVSLSLAKAMLKIAPTAHITVFADGTLLQWMFDDVAAFNLIPTEVAGIFRTLRMYCLKVSAAKTGVLHSWWGSRMSATAKPHVAKIQGKRFFVVRLDGDTLYLPVVASHKYLGIIPSYKNCEMLSLRYRLRQAWIAFNRLSCALKSRKLPVVLRLRLCHAVCIACATYGLSSIGLSSEGRAQYHATIMRQLRMVIGDRSFLTGRTRAEILEMYNIKDPLLHVDSLLLRRVQLAQNNSYIPHHEALVQHWALLIFSLSTPEPSQPKMAHRRPESTSVKCEVCGQEFQDLAAYRFHHTKVHLQRTQEEQKDYRKQMIHRDSNHMHHAIGGLPHCRHCGRKFSAWTNFMSHFNRQCCPVLHLGEDQPAHLRDLTPFRSFMIRTRAQPPSVSPWINLLTG